MNLKRVNKIPIMGFFYKKNSQAKMERAYKKLGTKQTITNLKLPTKNKDLKSYPLNYHKN
jgi:hypothetical protein